MQLILKCLADYGKEITRWVRGRGEIKMEWIEYEKLGNLNDLTE